MGTNIEWTDETWSPLIGCDRISAGCDRCYAIGTSNMRAAHPNPKIAAAFAGTTARIDGRIDWTGTVNLLPERLDQPLHWRRPRMVFINSLSDLFHPAVPDDFIADVFAVIACAQQHTFQLLTKRHARMRALLSSQAFRSLVFRRANDRPADVRPDLSVSWPLPNLWLGVSTETQKWCDTRVPVLLDTPAVTRFISAEPLLGPLTLCCCGGAHPARADPSCPMHGHTRLDWVIVGGESGSGARPMHPGWVRALRDECAEAAVPFLLKQWGEWTAAGNLDMPEPAYWVSKADGRVLDESAAMADGGEFTGVWRVGKKSAGRELDGCVYDEYPPQSTVAGGAR